MDNRFRFPSVFGGNLPRFGLFGEFSVEPALFSDLSVGHRFTETGGTVIGYTVVAVSIRIEKYERGIA